MKATKTLNPLHFEDLEPKRFEDLVRQLIYDFRDWYKIESTGRAGSDDGFDTRAWEKKILVEDIDETGNDENEEKNHTTEGNLWQIQCKREKEIGPKRIKEIVKESIKKEVPYGFLLAAPVNFSKKTYDAFATALRAKGVTEFFLWGKGELEQALLMPKNDRMLFAFFGISLVHQRRSRVSDIRFIVNNKNKLMRLIKNNYDVHEPMLLRDINDKDYPYKEKSKKEEIRPRWSEENVIEIHPKGLVFHIHEYYAFYDSGKNEFQFTKKVDLVFRQNEAAHNRDNKKWNDQWAEKEKVEYFYKNLPQKNQAKLQVYGFLSFEDMLFIDVKGDNNFEIPHIFVEYKAKQGPFTSIWSVLDSKGKQIDLDEKIKKADIFPEKFPEIVRGKIYKDKQIEWDEQSARQFRLGNLHRFHDIDNKYSFLNLKDVIVAVKANKDDNGNNFEEEYAQVTHKYTINVKDYLEERKDSFFKESLERELGRIININEAITVFEIIDVHSWALKDDILPEKLQ